MKKIPITADLVAETRAEKFLEAWKMAGLPADGVLLSSGLRSMNVDRSLQEGAKFRDKLFTKYPLIPEAAFIFQQIVAAREWAIGGKPDAVYKSLDLLNGAESKNRVTGLVDIGFEGFLKRRAVDYLTIGRTVFAYGDSKWSSGSPALMYMDPIELYLDRKKRTVVSKRGYVLPISPTERCWKYDGEEYLASDLVIHHPFPIGSDNFVAPISFLIPAANLAWLLNEHNTASLDGRKIKDLLLVSSPLRDSIEEGLLTLAKNYNGADVSENGIPIIEINNLMGTPIKDLFAMVGFSNVPESLDQERFMFNFANQVSGAFGVTLRHFWNDERNTNRALEEVQEARQQQKGPTAFIRSEQRLINTSGFLKRVSGSEVRFGFIEESDMSSLKTKAEVLKAYGEAVMSFRTLFSTSLPLQSYLSWMKRIGAIPLDIELSEEDIQQVVPAVDPNMDPNNPQQPQQQQQEQPKMKKPEQTAVSQDQEQMEKLDIKLPGDPDVVHMEKSNGEVERIEQQLQSGEVVVDRNGYIIGKRQTIFVLSSLSSLISEKVRREKQLREEKIREAVVKAEQYETGEGDGDSEIDNIVDIVEHQMFADVVGKLRGIETLTTKERHELDLLFHKATFNFIYEEDERALIEEIAKKYEVEVI